MSKPVPHRAKSLTDKVDKAEVQVGIDKLDRGILSELSARFHKELKNLDRWILFSDHSLMPKIQPLIDYVKETYKIPSTITLYRGFRASGVQDNLGMEVEGLFRKTVRAKPGDTGSFVRNTPLSTSAHPALAAQFGDVVVSMKVTDEIFPITDELNYFIGELRGFDQSRSMSSQYEYVLLPTQRRQTYTVLRTDAAQKNSKWTDW